MYKITSRKKSLAGVSAKRKDFFATPYCRYNAVHIHMKLNSLDRKDFDRNIVTNVLFQHSLGQQQMCSSKMIKLQGLSM